ncbi:MAG TPA: S8 family serine peptidase [Thermoanaerobaculia bacterium]|nr:S8 family serine peptidase [Thermoanaerobaculia bacterium]
MDVRAAQRRTVELKPPTPPAAKGGTKTAAPAAEATDFYWFNGQRIPLRRSQSEVVVRVKGNTPAGSRDVVSEGRRFRVVAANDEFRASPAVEAVAGVFEHPKSGTKLLATDEIVVKLRAGGTKRELLARAEAHGLTVDRALWGTRDEFVLRLVDPRNGDTLEKARLLHESGDFAFAEPHFLRQYKKHALPNDTRFGQQWHLNNTAQGGGTSGADVDAVTAWNTNTGSSSIVIAIVDDGVEKAHEDLAANIFVNPGETAGNGLDDDHNGFIDDVSGWDFSNNDNDADPFDDEDMHGTAVAGVAAARGNNNLGVTGACQTCKILPVKIFSPDYAGDVAVANALRYAASLADVVNNSWGGGAPSATLQSAIQTGTTQGRGGKGSAMMFATGNDVGGNFIISSPVLPAGTHRFRWSYVKDESFDDGDDSAWLAWALFPGGTLVHFEGGMPAGFTTGGDSNWSVVTDVRHSDEGRCFLKAAKAGGLDDEESNYIEVVKTLASGTFYSYQSVSSEYFFDGLVLDIDLGNNGTIDLSTDLISGVPFMDLDVSYPAAHPESIAVGASTNFDCRSDYSQFGPEVAFVAPSSGGPLNLGIETTDRTGANGYDSASYTLAAGDSGFGGTSSATPLASGVAGLLLSRNPSLTVTQLKTAMQNSADKVGGEPYVSGRNNRYGHGRVNADAALLSIASCATIGLTSVVPDAQTLNAYSQSFVASGGVPTYIYAVTVGSLPPGLTLSVAGLLSGTPTAAGTYSFTVQATDANGCTGYRTVNMAVTVGTPPPPGASLYIVTPCRVIDSRDGTALTHLATRDVQFTGVCGIPTSAKAVVANLTAVNPVTTGFLALYPTGAVWPGTSTMNYRLGKTRANNAILPLSNLGKATILNNGSTQHFIIDVTGYFE